MVFSAYQLTKEPRELNGQAEEQAAVCLSVQLFECLVWLHVLNEWIRGVEAEAWHLSGWGAYENIGSNPGQISTSVIKAVVTDSQTLKVLPPLPAFPKKINLKKRSRLYLFAVTSLGGAPGQGCVLIRFFVAARRLRAHLGFTWNQGRTVLFLTFKASFTHLALLRWSDSFTFSLENEPQTMRKLNIQMHGRFSEARSIYLAGSWEMFLLEWSTEPPALETPFKSRFSC